MTTIAVIGLGEAGALYARELGEAGYTVTGFDPFVTLGDSGVHQEAQLSEAVSAADMVISLVGARAAELVAREALASMQQGAVFADLNTGSPSLKRTLGEAASAHDIRFADVAVLAPVPRSGVRTPLMASGDGAEQFAHGFAAAGAQVLVIGGRAGDAAARKLVRSVFMKGLAALVMESIAAARAAGCEDWLREQIAVEFAGDAPQLIQRLIDGSRQHAERRAHEVDDARAFLEDLDSPKWVTTAARRWFDLLLRGEGFDDQITHQGVTA